MNNSMIKPMTIPQCWSMIAATAILLVCMLLASGCQSLFRSDKPKYDFPAWANAECHGALNEAIAIIERVGVHQIKLKDLRVQVIPGQRKFGNSWGWWVDEPSWPNGGEWVGGLTSGWGHLIQIVCDPNRIGDPAALHMPSLVHEMVHALLISAGYGGEHLAVYDGLVPGWAEARRVIGKRVR